MEKKYAGLSLYEIAKMHKDNELIKALVARIIDLQEQLNESDVSVAGIEYDGKWPNLCSGRLVVTLSNGKKIDFGEHCLSSGGHVSFDKEWNSEVAEGNWSVSKWPKEFPERLKRELIDKINDEIEHGCCGGCV